MKNRLLIITPVSHIENFLKKSKKYFKTIYIPNISKKILKNLQKNKKKKNKNQNKQTKTTKKNLQKTKTTK